MDKIKLPEGFKLGHSGNGKTGVSVVLCESGAVGGVDVRGCAPGTRETDLMRPEKAVERVNAVALCGGSAYGLNACGGVMEYLKEKGAGHKMGPLVVPIVAGAVIFDLDSCGYDYPTSSMGYDACKNAVLSGLEWGGVGAGTGASIGKILGPQYCSKGGIGAMSNESGGVLLTAVAVVNAVGDVYDPDNGNIVSGAKLGNGQFLSTKNFILNSDLSKLSKGANTTLVCIMTDAKLTKLQANKLASIGQDGLALAIRPVHTDYDGDTVFALSCGEKQIDFTQLCVMAVEAVSKAIVNAVKNR